MFFLSQSTRSTDTLTKGSDYRKMLASTTSMESMEKSQFNSSLDDNQSFDIYEAHNPNTNVMPLTHTTFVKKPITPEYSVPQNNARQYGNLAFRNEGYRDNSGTASGAPSINTVATEEIPILHQHEGIRPPDEYTLSPHNDSQYYTSDTLPLRDNSDDGDLKRQLERAGKIYGPYGAPAGAYGAQPKLSFLMELRSKMPEQPQAGAAPTTTFGQRNNVAGNLQSDLINRDQPTNPKN